MRPDAKGLRQIAAIRARIYRRLRRMRPDANGFARIEGGRIAPVGSRAGSREQIRDDRRRG